MPRGPDDASILAMARALEFTKQRVNEVIEEARKHRCFFYKSHQDASTGIIYLRFTDAVGISFQRSLNCNSFFKAGGVYSKAERSQIVAAADALVLTSGEFQRHRSGSHCGLQR